MIEIIDLATWAAGAVIAAGILQWTKGLIPKAPRWVWAAASPIAAFAAAIASGGDKWAWNWLGVWACSQLFYETIIQAIRKKIKGE
jgi:hypothetical protein